jgi:hypothetical protein
MEEIDIEIYETAFGKRPFEIWIKGLKEIHTRAKILTRVDRLRYGNFGFTTVRELEFIMERLGIKSFYSFAEATRVPRIGISRKQESILTIINLGS